MSICLYSLIIHFAYAFWYQNIFIKSRSSSATLLSKMRSVLIFSVQTNIYSIQTGEQKLRVLISLSYLNRVKIIKYAIKCTSRFTQLWGMDPLIGDATPQFFFSILFQQGSFLKCKMHFKGALSTESKQEQVMKANCLC